MNKRIKIFLLLTLSLLTLVFLASCEGSGFHIHEWGVYGVNSATCTEGGTQSRVCNVCQTVDVRNTSPLGHNLTSYEDKDATCTEEGYLGYKTCSRCDHTEGTLIKPLGHNMSDWFGNTAGCLEGGFEYANCFRCGFKDERATDPHGHRLDSSGGCKSCGGENILILIENGKANFNVVYTVSAGSAGKIAVDNFVKMLRDLGIEVNDPISDSNPTKVTDCEIIIGADARNRGEDCCVTSAYLGREGETVKFVGQKIIIAAGLESTTRTLFENYVANELGITKESACVDYVEADMGYGYENVTDYVIDTITIGSLDLNFFKLVVDMPSAMLVHNTQDIDNFHTNLYNVSGYWLETVSASQMNSYSNYFIIRYVDDAGADGFRAYIDGNNFVVECAYKNAFNKTFAEMIENLILNKTGDVTIDKNFSYSKEVSVVYYEDYGAKGDGVTCDYTAIYNAHSYANKGGQIVKGKAGATYYISPELFMAPIIVKTDVDFCGASFIINDVGEHAHLAHSLPLFKVDRDSSEVLLGTSRIKTLSGEENFAITYGTTSIPWLSQVLKGKSIISVTNGNHKDFVRHGSNQNTGAARTEIYIVDVNGNIAEDTPVAFEFDCVTAIRIYYAEDKPITIQNGNFTNICCRVVKSTYNDLSGTRTYYANDWIGYYRGFAIYRTNVTIKNLTHKMQGEPELGWYPTVANGYLENDADCGYVEDSKHKTHGSRHESYPYYGFLYVDKTYNLNVLDCEITGHTTYYEDKPATASTGGEVPTPVPMGSYDFVIEYSSNVTFKNVKQISDTGLGDSRYWGIMSSNGSRNLTFEDCEINRFDAHRGFWNATLKNTTIGHSFNVIGGGTLLAEGVTKLVGNQFIYLRSDYGATFKGNIILKDCVFEGYGTYNTSKGTTQSATRYSNAYVISSGFNTSNYGWSDTAESKHGAYWLWDFGYTCYMPIEITLDNFKFNMKKAYLFNNLPDAIFEYTYVDDESVTKETVKNVYQLTKKITYIDLPKDIPICNGKATTYTKLYSIPIERQ